MKYFSESELSQFGQKPLATIANPGYYSPHIAMSARQLTTKFTATWLWSTTVGRLSGIPGGGLCRRADLNWEPQCFQPNTLPTTPLIMFSTEFNFQLNNHIHFFIRTSYFWLRLSCSYFLTRFWPVFNLDPPWIICLNASCDLLSSFSWSICN